MKKNGKIEFYRFPTHVVAYLIALFAYIISVSMSMNKTRLIARMILNVDEPER